MLTDSGYRRSERPGRGLGRTGVAVLSLAMVLMIPTVRAGQDSGLSPAGAVPEVETSALQLSVELERRQRALERLQGELGLYHPALVERYDELADFYREHEDFEQALEMHRQAFQVTRINAGLNSGQQLPYIDSMIESSVALSDWQQVDELHQLRYYLKERLFDPADPRYAGAIAELGEWKLQAMRENLLSGTYAGIGREAEQLSEIYRTGIARIQARPDFSEASLLPLYQGKSHADLEVARVLADTPYQFFEGTVSRFVYETVCSNVSDGQGGVVRQCRNVQRENPRYRDSQRDNKRMLVSRSVREVEASLQNLTAILSRNPDIPDPDRQRLATEIQALEAEYQRIQRTARRRLLY